jgi:hypothetical protein
MTPHRRQWRVAAASVAAFGSGWRKADQVASTSNVSLQWFVGVGGSCSIVARTPPGCSSAQTTFGALPTLRRHSKAGALAHWVRLRFLFCWAAT